MTLNKNRIIQYLLIWPCVFVLMFAAAYLGNLGEHPMRWVWLSAVEITAWFFVMTTVVTLCLLGIKRLEP